MADRIAVMYAGRLAELGPAKTVANAPRHPYTRSLLAAIPSLEGKMPIPLPGQPPLDGPAETGCAFAPRCPRASEGCRSARDAMDYFSRGNRRKKKAPEHSLALSLHL